MRLTKLIFALCLLMTFSVVKVNAYTDAKTGQAQLNMNKLLSSTMVKHDHRWCRTEGWNTVCYDNNLYEDCTLFCNNNNNYTYNFDYEVKKNHSDAWKPLEKKDLFKCDTVKSKFSVIGDWGATLEKKCAEVWRNIVVYSACWSHSPPTDIIECSGKEDCLYKARGYTLTPEYSGKGVQQVPANFVSGVEKSLVSDNSGTVCSDGVCPINKEGKYNLTMKAPETMYYGQCKGYGMTLEPDGTKIPEATGSLALDVVNRAPTTTISFSNKNSKINEEVDVYCDAFDPDDCVDKISKVTLSCQDSKGDTSGCLIYDPSVGTLGSSLVKEIGSTNQTNPFRLAAKFKVTKPGSYMVICNAMDNNGTSSTYPNGTDDGSGIGVNGVTVKEDGTTVNGGVIDSSMNFCALVADKGAGSPVCDSKSDIKLSAEAMYNLNPVKYQWRCGDGENEEWKDTTEGKYTCSYPQAGTFVPALRVVSKDGKTTDCKLQGKIKITAEKSCRVEARKANTTEEFSDKVIIKAGDSVETRVKQECLGKLPITWSAAGGSIEGTKDGLTTIKFGAAGEKSVGAKMTNTVKYTEEIVEKDEFGNTVKDSKGNDIVKKVEKERKEVTDCTGVTIDVKDLNNWGN